MTPGATPYRFRMGSADPVTRVTMVRAGSVTHAFNFDQSFVALVVRAVSSVTLVWLDRQRRESLQGPPSR